MVKNVTIIRPARLDVIPNKPAFIPLNSKDQLLEVDMGFSVNPVYKQDKLCLFVNEHIYYQKLVLEDGKGNAIKDDARTIVITGETASTEQVTVDLETYPGLAEMKIDTIDVSLPFYPELNTEIVIRDKIMPAIFYHFSCTKIVYRAATASYLQLRLLGYYNMNTIATIFRKWHSKEIDLLENISANPPAF